MNNFKAVSVGSMAIVCFWFIGCNSLTLEERVSNIEDQMKQIEDSTTLQSQYVSSSEATKVAESTIPTSPATAIVFDKTTHEFGDITEGDIVEHTFEFTNTGNTPLIIIDAETTCGCTVPNKPEAPIPPGGTDEIQVRFDSRGKAGIVSKAVTIITNTEPNTTRLFIKADVKPKNEPITQSIEKQKEVLDSLSVRSGS